MSTRRGAAGSFAAALLLAVLTLVLVAQPAQGRPLASVPLAFSFDMLFPGEARSESRAVSIPVDAVIADTTLDVGGTGAAAFTWTVSLCPAGSGACLPLTSEAAGSFVPAGDYELIVAVETSLDVVSGADSTVSGRLGFAEHSAPGGSSGLGPDAGLGASTSGGGGTGLADTGVVGATFAWAALVLTVLGLVLLLAGRRRRDERPAVTA